LFDAQESKRRAGGPGLEIMPVILGSDLRRSGIRSGTSGWPDPAVDSTATTPDNKKKANSNVYIVKGKLGKAVMRVPKPDHCRTGTRTVWY